jgi:predicted nuclease with TOPRIM domain
VLRKFFRTKLATVIPVDIVEALMGHEGYLTEVYRKYTQEDLAKYYLKGESALLIYTEAQDVTELRKEVEERNKQLQTMANGLYSENQELKNRISLIEGEVSQLKKTFQSFIDKSKKT